MAEVLHVRHRDRWVVHPGHGDGDGHGDGHGHGDHDHDHAFENAAAEVFNVLHRDCGDGQDGGEEVEEDDDDIKTVD